MSADSMASGWYYSKRTDPTGGQQASRIGPLSWEEFYRAAQAGAFGPNDLVWNQQYPEWLPGAQVPGLFPMAATPERAARMAAAAPAETAASFSYPAAHTPARRRMPPFVWLLPLIALIIVGAGLGTYFGFFYDSGKSSSATLTTTAVDSTTTTVPGPAGTAEAKAPDRAKLVDTTNWGEVPANEIIVVLADGKTREDADSLARALGGAVVGQVEFVNAYQIETAGSTEADLEGALQQASAAPGVESAFADQEGALDTEIWGVRQSPLTDPVYGGGRDKGFQMIGAEKAWAYVRGSGLHLWNVQVGVVDNGLYKGTGEFDGDTNFTFPDRDAGQLTAPLKDTNDDNGITVDEPTGSHGTMVAGIIGADPSNGKTTGIASPVLGNHLTISMINSHAGQYGNSGEVAPDPNDPTKYVWSNGKTYSMGGLVAITKQIEDGAKIINCSWGVNLSKLKKQYQQYQNGEMSAATYAAIYASYQKTAAFYKKFFQKMEAEHPDVLFVCSAGNDGMQMDGSIRWPSGLAQDDMITVGNLMNDGTTASSSNRVNTDPGEEFEVTLAAPGQEVVQGVDEDGNPVTDQTDIGNGHYFGGGTSAATPQVTAAAAIMMSLNPNLKPADIKRILSETARPGPANVGGKVLAIDQAVLEVINDMRERQGLPAVTGDELEKAGGIDAVATTTDEPDVYSVRGIVTMVPEGGMDIAISGSTGVTVEGAETTQAISDAGEVSWPVVTASIVDPEHPTTITVTRTDNGAASVITLEQIDLNGSWTGTYTITDITVDQDALSTLTSEESSSSDNLAEGCSGGAAMAAVLAVLDQLKGQPIPMTMDVTADMEAGTGQAVITLDPSGLDLGEGVTTGEPESTTIPFTFASPALTFQLPPSEGSTTSMTGTVSQKDDTFVIDGTMTSSGTGFSMTAVFKVTKPK